MNQDKYNQCKSRLPDFPPNAARDLLFLSQGCMILLKKLEISALLEFRFIRALGPPPRSPGSLDISPDTTTDGLT